MQDDSDAPRYRALKQGQACLACRRVKHKCDAIKPTCGPCARRKTECVYEDWRNKTRVELMQEKVLDLESQIDRLQHTNTRASSQPGYSNSLYSPPTASLLEPMLMESNNSFQTSSSSRSRDHYSSQQYRQPPRLPRWPGITGNWWEIDPLPVPVRDHLIGLWIPYSRRNGLDVYLPRFLASFDSPTDPPHPAVVNVICLLGCYFSGFASTGQGRYSPDLTALEPILLQRVRSALQHSLAYADRLYSFIIASYHLVMYFSLKGRLTEAQLESSTASRFAISCGLNRLPSSLISAAVSSTRGEAGSRAGALLDPTTDVIDIWERVNLFWALYFMDVAFFVVAGYPTAIPVDEIEIPWPQSLEGFQQEFMYPHPQSHPRTKTVRALFENDSADATCTAQDSYYRIRLKAITVMSHSSRLGRILASNPGAEPNAAFWSDYAATFRAMSALRSSLPDYRVVEPPISVPQRFALTQYPPGGDWAGAGLSPTLVAIHTLVHSAAMQQHSLFAHVDRTERQECLRSANEISKIAFEVADLDPLLLPATISVGWVGAFRILNGEIQRLQNRGDNQSTGPLRADIEKLRHILRRWNAVWPLLGSQGDLNL